jgi:hypothetical protein
LEWHDSARNDRSGKRGRKFLMESEYERGSERLEALGVSKKKSVQLNVR